MLVDGRVADIEPHSELDLLVVVGSVLGDALLDCDGGIHRLVDAVEGDKKGVAGSVAQKALMGREPRVDDIAEGHEPMPGQRVTQLGELIVAADEAAVAAMSACKITISRRGQRSGSTTATDVDDGTNPPMPDRNLARARLKAAKLPVLATAESRTLLTVLDPSRRLIQP